MTFQQKDLEWLLQKLKMSKADYEEAQTVLKLVNSSNYPKIVEYVAKEIAVLQSPRSTLSAKIKSFVLFRVIFSTGEYCAVNLVETLVLPFLSNFIEVMGDSSKKRSPSYIQEEVRIGSTEMANLQRISIRFVHQFLYTSAKVKPFCSVFNSYIKHPSKYFLLAEALQTNKSTLKLQYFLPSYVSEINLTYLEKLSRFKSEKYSDYFANKICDQIEFGNPNYFSLLPIYESGDIYITQPIIDFCTEKLTSTTNRFEIKKMYLRMFAIAVENGFIQSLLAFENEPFYEQLISQVCAVEGQKGIDAGEQFYLQICGTREERIDFYVSFLITLQRWAHTFPIDSQGNPSLLSRDYHHLKDSVHFVFPKDEYLEDYKIKTINNFKLNAQRNKRIVDEEIQEKDSDKIMTSFGNLLFNSQQLLKQKLCPQQVKRTIKEVPQSEENVAEAMAKLNEFRQQLDRRNQSGGNSPECLNQLEKIKLLEEKYQMYKDGTINFKQFSALAMIVSEGKIDHALLMVTSQGKDGFVGKEILESATRLTDSSPFKSKRKNSWYEAIKTNDLIENKMISSKVIKTESENNLIQKSKSYGDFSNLMKEKYSPTNFQEALTLNVNQPATLNPINLIRTLPNKPATFSSSKRVELGRELDEEDFEDKQAEPLPKQKKPDDLVANDSKALRYNPQEVYPTNKKSTAVVEKQSLPVESTASPVIQTSISPLINQSGNNFDSLLLSKSVANMSQASNQNRDPSDSNPEKAYLNLQSNVSQQPKFKGADLRVFKIFQNSKNSKSKNHKVLSQEKIYSPIKRVLSPKLEKPTKLQNKTLEAKRSKGVKLLQPEVHASYFQNVDSFNLRAKKGLLRSKNLLFSSTELQIGVKDSVVGNRFETTLFITMLKKSCFGVKISTVNYMNLRFEYDRNSFSLLKQEQHKFGIRSVVMATPYEIPLFRLSYPDEASHKNHEIIFPLPIGFNKLCSFMLVPQQFPSKFEENVVETPWFTRSSKLLKQSLAKETLFDFTELSSSKYESVLCSKVSHENSKFLIRVSLKKGLAQITGKSLTGESSQEKNLGFLLATLRCMFEGDS